MRSNALVMTVPDTSAADAVNNLVIFPGLRLRSDSEANRASETLVKVALWETRRNESWETLGYIILATAAVGATTIALVQPW